MIEVITLCEDGFMGTLRMKGLTWPHGIRKASRRNVHLSWPIKDKQSLGTLGNK